MLLDIFNHEQFYDNDYESFCGHNCVRQILEYYGVKQASFFINSALGLTLVQDEQAKFGYKLLFDKTLVLGDYDKKLHRFAPRNKSAVEVWEENKAKIKEGMPIVAGADIFYFHYTPYFNKFHSDHRVILCGYSDAENCATIIDHYQWKFKGNIGINDFLEARSSLCPRDEGPYSGSPIDNFWLEVDRDGWNATSEELFFETISRSFERYYNVKANSKENHYEGVEALRKLLELIIEYKETGKEDSTEFLREAHMAVLFVYTRLKLFKYYMQISSLSMKIDILPQIKDDVVEEIKVWEMLIRFVLKCMYTKDDSLYIKIISNFNKIISMQEKRYTALEKLIKLLAS